MSNFIVPMGNLPTISSLTDLQGRQNAQNIGTGGDVFSNMLQTAIQNTQQAEAGNNREVLDLALGGNDDLHTGAIAALKAQTSVSFTGNLVSAAIRAYNELMRMQI